MDSGPCCYEDTQAPAVSCCVCKFPLPLLCLNHEKKHQMSLQGFHFILPLSALDIITSETVHLNAVQWLFKLNSNFTVLKKKSEQVSRCGDEIEAVCGELLHYAGATVERVKREFAKVKEGFNHEVDRAIVETQTRALDSGDQASTNPLAQLLWYWEPVQISGYQMFTFQAKCDQECVDSAVDVTFNSTLPGLEHLRFEHSQKMKQAEYDAINKELEDAKSSLRTEIERSTNLEDEVQKLTQQLQDGRKQLQSIQEICATKDKRNSFLELRIAEAEKQVKEKDSQVLKAMGSRDLSSAEVTRLQREIQELRNDAAGKDQSYKVLEQEKRVLTQQVQDLSSQLEVSRANLNLVMKELNEGGTGFPDLQRPMQHLLAVWKDKIRPFEIASSTWKQPYLLQSQINCDECSSSTSIGENKIFVCGGGPDGSRGKVYLDAFKIDGYRTVTQVSPMDIPRKFQGIVYDPYANAVYVFGGWNKGESGFSVLRSSEKIRLDTLTWEALPDMNDSRSRFNPCMYSWVVYLCGGNVTSVETFNPMTNTFTLLPEFKLPEANNCLAVVDSGHIVVISWNFICKWSLQQKKMTLRKQHPKCSPWSTFTPVVSGDTVYAVDLKDCRGFRWIENKLTIIRIQM